MSQDEISELPCVDKLSFDSKDEALASATVAEWRHGTKLKVYLCKNCDLWHMSSN